MKNYLAIDARQSLGIMVLVVLCIGAYGSRARVYAENSPTAAAVAGLNTNGQNDSWIAADTKGRVGHPVLIRLNLSPYPPPPGAFYTAIVDVLESPEGAKPEILPGVPEISVRCPKPGIYRLRIRANQIEKSSCALADARILKEQEIQLTITP